MPKARRRQAVTDQERLRSEYEGSRPELERFGAEMKAQFESLLSKYDLALGIPLECRVKSWTSIVEKIERRAMSISSLNEMPDLVGLRAVFLFQRDLTTARTIIQDKFQVSATENTGERLDESQFGYQSWHYVVQLPPAWLAVPSLKSFGNLQAELQVRTLAQHIWAAASHKLQYKHESSIPAPVRRAIHRVSALLETVDLEFETVLRERASYLSTVGSGEDNEVLNVDLLSHILDQRLPPDNKGAEDAKDYAELLTNLMDLGVTTTYKLKQLIHKRLEAARDDDRWMVSDIKKNGRFQTRTERARLKRGVFYSFAGLVRRMLRAEFGNKAAQAWESAR
jgi:putative GTP pyrophosphokinase